MNRRSILPYPRGYTLLFLLFYPFFLSAQCGTCDYTEASLTGATPLNHIPAGRTLCITTSFCLGTNSAYPSACGNHGTGTLTIDGTLRLCSGVSFGFDGTINGSGSIQIMAGGRMSLYGTYDCNVHMTAVDPGLLNGQTSTSSTLSGSCNSAACEPKFSGGYAPFGVVSTGLGYTVNNGSCAITGESSLFVLPVELLDWNVAWNNGNIAISWSAPGDEKGDIYTIDYSADGEDWTALAQVPATDGKGIGPYSYLAKGPFGAHSYFRLVHTSADGVTSISPVRQLDAAPQTPDDGFIISPNPAHDVLQIRSDKPDQLFSWKLFDLTGRPVRQSTWTTGYGQYDLGALVPGAYVLVITKDNGSRVVRKITRL